MQHIYPKLPNSSISVNSTQDKCSPGYRLLMVGFWC